MGATFQSPKPKRLFTIAEFEKPPLRSELYCSCGISTFPAFLHSCQIPISFLYVLRFAPLRDSHRRTCRFGHSNAAPIARGSVRPGFRAFLSSPPPYTLKRFAPSSKRNLRSKNRLSKANVANPEEPLHSLLDIYSSSEGLNTLSPLCDRFAAARLHPPRHRSMTRARVRVRLETPRRLHPETHEPSAEGEDEGSSPSTERMETRSEKEKKTREGHRKGLGRLIVKARYSHRLEAKAGQTLKTKTQTIHLAWLLNCLPVLGALLGTCGPVFGWFRGSVIGGLWIKIWTYGSKAR
ncbi:hypothetical protein L596_026338 [Steinernema carpocapsae]|uniref:Uncharacterized protein n=1 Tax=Steinernema carpocapsae TaxID=34508 RepID=A0A4U5M134_STECR|nr:hypothetical protein L596_026338 [Steinernema carpocapsae]